MFFYKFFTTIFYPIIRLYLGLRRKRGKEDADNIRFNERLGRASIPRPDGFLLWIHGASVGEVNSLRGLIPRIKRDYPYVNILVTCGTVTGMRTAKNLDTISQYVPIDIPFIVRRFMKHWHPDMAIRVDSDLWPVQLDALRKNKTPNFLINGAVTSKSFKKWMRRKRFIRRIMSSFTFVMAKSDRDAMRLSSMGADNVMVINNLKYTTPPPADKPTERTAFMRSIGKRPLWHAAVLGEGEQDIIYAAHKLVLKKIPDAMVLITPRHPSMKELLGQKTDGMSIAFRSDNAAPDADIYVADTLGEMGLFYRVSKIAFMGRSLLPDTRGSSPIEAMQLGNVVTTGPYTSTFDEIYDEMTENGILERKSTPAEIAKWVISMLSGDSAGTKLQAAQKKFTDAKVDTLDTIMYQLKDALK